MRECLGCNFIETSPVTLRDGRTVCTSCPDWLLECEARMILKKPLQERRDWLQDLAKKRGNIDALKAEIVAQHRGAK